MKFSIFLTALILPLLAVAESPQEKSARLQWFNEARFGLFIHWGAYSAAGGEWNGKPVTGDGSWIQLTGRVPAKEYRDTLLSQFNPVKYDAESWVLAAKNAGMRYVVITAKHHDGFCLWDSKVTDWSIASTPYKKDVLKPLAEACRKHGIKFCLYYSIMDWHHPEYGDKAAWRGNARTPKPDMEAYSTFQKNQLKELLQNYGDVGILWFDGEWESSWSHERAVDLYGYLRTLQPGIIINNRIDKSRAGMEGWSTSPESAGDYDTPEQQIPAKAPAGDISWESCMTMNDTWGYKRNDKNWKPASALVRNLIDAAAKGGNYLLNVGPDGEGVVPQASLDCLAEIGKWMSVNGESIHGTTASIFRRYSWDGCSTTRRNADGSTTLYLHLFSLPPDGRVIIRNVESKPLKAEVLGVPGGIEINGEPGAWSLKLPQGQSVSVATVVKLRMAGVPVIREMPIAPDASGVVLLDPEAVTLHGEKMQIEKWDGVTNIGFWLDPADFVFWNVKMPKGKYRVQINGSCGTDGSELKIQLGALSSGLSFPPTGTWRQYRVIDGGILELPSDTSGEFTIRAISGSGVGFVNIRSVTLIRVEE